MVKVEGLKKQFLFEGLDKAQLKYLAGVIEEISLKKNSILFKEGDNTKGFYLIRSGVIEISKITVDGWKQNLALLKTGNFFGELSLMEKRSHEATAVALEKTELLLLKKETFETIEKEEAKLALQIMKKIALAMSKNLRRMNEKFLNALVNY
jgi:CRP-like cAMP-binding protein